ncbi:MAG: sugar phosphate isomerase/epimerase family protein, partial [Chitinophagaceae bacterium]
LYSIRDVFEKDPKGVIKQIADFGYKQLEGYERSPGIFWGMKNTEFKKYIEDLGMIFISSHCDTENDFERKASEAGEIGMKYLIYNWEGPNKTIEDYKLLAEDFNRKGEICRKNGLRFGFHNYSFSLKTIEGQIPQDVLMQHTDPALVDFQMEIYWFAMMNMDTKAWLKKYSGRFKLCHIKDRVKGSIKQENTCDLGNGSIEFPSILRTAGKNGMEYYIVEQEDYPNSTSLKSAKANAGYMKKLKI